MTCQLQAVRCAWGAKPGASQRLDVSQWEFQDPKMEVRWYHIRPYFVGMFPYIGLKIGLIYGRYLQSIGSWKSHWKRVRWCRLQKDPIHCPCFFGWVSCLIHAKESQIRWRVSLMSIGYGSNAVPNLGGSIIWGLWISKLCRYVVWHGSQLLRWWFCLSRRPGLHDNPSPGAIVPKFLLTAFQQGALKRKVNWHLWVLTGSLQHEYLLVNMVN